MTKFKGMGYQLSEQEIKVLLAFGDELEIAAPVGCDMSLDETLRVCQKLTEKDILVGRGPFRLTKLGQRLQQGLKE